MDAADLITERYRLLDGDGQTILGFAALLGYRPNVAYLVRCLDGRSATVIDALDMACELDLAVRESRKPPAYRFRHALVQDAVRKALGFERARLMHATIAAILEVLPNCDALVEELAYHWSAAGVEAKADVYRAKAAQEARRLGV